MKWRINAANNSTFNITNNSTFNITNNSTFNITNNSTFNITNDIKQTLFHFINAANYTRVDLSWQMIKSIMMGVL